ncbi:hypothetical protein CVU37_11335 [candidate division BRC1 bacterium HGW-BRC1-1]|nr:MAG: hypothetical protein CVU37_11335 [candidate division BRC1 bacterium HGW-BRC1-1]
MILVRFLSASLTICTILLSTLGMAQLPVITSTPLPVTSSTPAPSAAPTHEFRGLWVATVANIDWPSRRGLPSDQQQKEMVELLDRAKALNFNAIVFQVRPACDALYDSKLEPWSVYLTGKTGQPPTPLYDPLTFAVSEAHKRGMELHAWFNPYRAGLANTTSTLPANHVAISDPQMVRQYGTKLWLDPGMPEVQDYSLRVVMDVVKRYDIDGVHFDDYFYPYVERDANKNAIPFPDESSYQAYLKRGGKLELNDWRRDSVNRFIKSVYTSVKATKPHVKVGISPFGIWKSGTPPGISGLSSVNELYADSKLWLNEGWVDYMTPQLYWKISSKQQSYPTLLAWWVSENTKKRHIWPGLHTSLTGNGSKAFSPTEIVEQIALTREQPGATGEVHFSARAIMRNQGGVADALLAGPYAKPALIPESPWLPPPPAGSGPQAQ